MPDDDALTVTVDGEEIHPREGEWLIAAAERHGTYIPRFCYHPRMRPVGMCRMCLVEIDTGRGPALQIACTTPVADGMTVITRSDKVKKAQDGVLELLLINHPLDCPVCDRGGECPLQDQTLAFGPGESRFVEEKRHFEKPIPISALVQLDRERCILCDRCTRFSNEVAGDPLISFIDRGNHTQVNTFPDHPFASYFSGNTVQICPVGALTASPYRFRARPWDLDQVESTCTSCSVGCRVAVQSSTNRLVRYLGVDVDPVNWGWLCDKGRFDFEAVNSDARLGAPLVRQQDALAQAHWAEALDKVATGLGAARLHPGPASIAVLGGARLTNEDAYAWAKLARAVIGTDSVDAQLGDGLAAEVVLGLPRATIDESCAADTVVLLAPDLKEELPVLYLRLRDAVEVRGAQLIELSPMETGMTSLAAVSLRYRPGEAARLMGALLSGGAPGDGPQATAIGQASEQLRKGSVVCVLGRPSMAEAESSVVEAASLLLGALPGTTFLSALRRANVHGALDMGLAPGVLPGRVGLEEGRSWFAEAWGELPTERGRDATGVLTAAAEGDIGALVLLGADPLADFPDRDLARRALAGARFVVAVDGFLTESARQADVVLAASGYAEKAGTTTNLEGRISRLNQKVTPPGTARPDWMIAVELARRLGGDLGFESLEDVWDEIERLAPSYAGITGARLASSEGLDGMVAGREPAAEGQGPPAMAQTEAPGVAGADSQMGVGNLAVTAAGTEASAVPEAGVAGSAGAPAGEAGAVGTSGYAEGQGAGAEAAASQAVESSVEAEHADQPSAPPSDGAREAPERPALLRFAPPAVAGPPPVDNYALRLVASRRLYDDGTLVQRSPSLARLVRSEDAAVRLNPAELDRLGVAGGDRLRVRSSRGAVVVVARADPGVPRGIAALVFNQPGPGAGDLIEAGAAVTDVRLDTVPAEPVPAAPGGDAP